MIFLWLILLVPIVYLIFLVFSVRETFFTERPPYVATDSRTIRAILEELKTKAPAFICEPGCGQADFLRLAGRAFPQAELVGLENAPDLRLINWIHYRLSGSRIKVLSVDFFKFDYQKADLIYCYLNSPTMARLGEIFLKQCSKGTRIVSRSFPIPQLTPEKILEIKKKKVYFYNI